MVTPQRRALLDRYAAINCTTAEGVRAFAALGRWLAITERPTNPELVIVVPAPRRRDAPCRFPDHHRPPAHGWPGHLGAGRPVHALGTSHRAAQRQGVTARHLA